MKKYTPEEAQIWIEAANILERYAFALVSDKYASYRDENVAALHAEFIAKSQQT